MKPEELNNYTVKELITALVNGLEKTTGICIWERSDDVNQLVYSIMNTINAWKPDPKTQAKFIWDNIHTGLSQNKKPSASIVNIPNKLHEYVMRLSIGVALTSIRTIGVLQTNIITKGEVYLFIELPNNTKPNTNDKLTWIPKLKTWELISGNNLQLVNYEQLSDKYKLSVVRSLQSLPQTITI